MKKSKFTDKQIISVLREAESGMKVEEICRKHGISSAIYYKWKSKFGGIVLRNLSAFERLKKKMPS